MECRLSNIFLRPFRLELEEHNIYKRRRIPRPTLCAWRLRLSEGVQVLSHELHPLFVALALKHCLQRLQHCLVGAHPVTPNLGQDGGRTGTAATVPVTNREATLGQEEKEDPLHEG